MSQKLFWRAACYERFDVLHYRGTITISSDGDGPRNIDEAFIAIDQCMIEMDPDDAIQDYRKDPDNKATREDVEQPVPGVFVANEEEWLAVIAPTAELAEKYFNEHNIQDIEHVDL